MPLPIPKFIKTAFAKIGLRNNIPESTNNTTGAAGYNYGFGEINMLPEGAGGIPPDGKDFNGIFYDLSAAIQYVQSGVAFPFNQDFATAIGGYEIGAIVSDASDKSLLWINGTASNTTFPTGWTQFTFEQATETVAGVAAIATTAEAKALTVAGKIIDPAKLGAVLGASVIRDVIASRSVGVTYTNTSKFLMFVNIGATTTVVDATAFMIVDGKTVTGSSFRTPGFSVAITAAVPPGATYLVPAGTFTPNTWTEVSL